MDDKYYNDIFDYEIVSPTTDKLKKQAHWNMAIGLQQVDNLVPSEYMKSLIKKNIEGEMTNDEVKTAIDAYYEPTEKRKETEKQCDIVSQRMVDLLETKSFTFSPVTLKSIHKYLFNGILPDKMAGVFRDYNISKKEIILNGETVVYGDFASISQLFDYDFAAEKGYAYSSPLSSEQISHLSAFVSRIWQVHPFGEGNTRTTAMFVQLYMNTMGFDVNNTLFQAYSKYFRNALVRSNYANAKYGVRATDEYLNLFFENLLNQQQNALNMAELDCSSKIPVKE